jgi:hypothetical protein
MSQSRQRTRRFRRVITTTLAVAVMALAAACSKKKPPPPLPPPPPPPPQPAPEPVSFDSISQEMKADPRVQFAGGLAITDESVARAVISLADAIARGDISKLDPLLSQPAKNVVKSLQESGEWSTATKDIEAVRVVYAASSGGATSGVLEQIGAMLSGTMTPEVMTQIASAITQSVTAAGAPPIDAASIATPEKIKEQWDRIMTDPAYEMAKAQIQTALASLPGLETGPEGQFLVITAVQDPSGAYLLGWGADQAFGTWVFTNSATVPDVKPRAADFDTVGPSGFASASGAALTPPPEAKAPDKPAEPAGEKPPPDKPKDPNRKNTPNGPVNIPQPPPGGG